MNNTCKGLFYLKHYPSKYITGSQLSRKIHTHTHIYRLYNHQEPIIAQKYGNKERFIINKFIEKWDGDAKGFIYISTKTISGDYFFQEYMLFKKAFDILMHNAGWKKNTVGSTCYNIIQNI